MVYVFEWRSTGAATKTRFYIFRFMMRPTLGIIVYYRNPLTKLPLQISLTFDGRIAIKEEVYQIIGAALEVYYTLGQGFLEPVYQQALEIELTRRRIPFKAQDPLNIEYKGEELDKLYKPDWSNYR